MLGAKSRVCRGRYLQVSENDAADSDSRELLVLV